MEEVRGQSNQENKCSKIAYNILIVDLLGFFVDTSLVYKYISRSNITKNKIKDNIKDTMIEKIAANYLSCHSLKNDLFSRITPQNRFHSSLLNKSVKQMRSYHSKKFLTPFPSLLSVHSASTIWTEHLLLSPQCQ